MTSVEAPDQNRAALRALLDRIDFGDTMRRRAIQQAIGDALPDVWRRRAQAFRGAAPKPSDFVGQATLHDLVQLGKDCLDTALACERYAALLEEFGLSEDLRGSIDDEIDLVLQGVTA
jgi:hypothetical protein